MRKTIASIQIIDNAVRISFSDNTTVELFDDLQMCCEVRYMTCDDDLNYFVGAEFFKWYTVNAPNRKRDDFIDHEVQFLEILTSRGVISVANHNEHNGYYSGFDIVERRV